MYIPSISSYVCPSFDTSLSIRIKIILPIVVARSSPGFSGLSDETYTKVPSPYDLVWWDIKPQFVHSFQLRMVPFLTLAKVPLK